MLYVKALNFWFYSFSSQSGFSRRRKYNRLFFKKIESTANISELSYRWTMKKSRKYIQYILEINSWKFSVESIDYQCLTTNLI